MYKKNKLLFSFLTICLSFFFVSNSFAAYSTYLNPDVSFLPATENINTASSTNTISDDSTTRDRFCYAMGGVYVSHVSTTDSTNGRAIYSGSEWNYESNSSVLDEIVCDVLTGSGPYVNGGNIGTGSTIAFAYQDNLGVYHIDEEFLVSLIIRIVFTIVAIPFLFYSTKKVWLMGRKLITGR